MSSFSIHSRALCRYWRCGVMTMIELLPSTGRKRNMPASGVPLSAPNTRSSAVTIFSGSALWIGNTPTDMPFSQSTSKMRTVRR